MQSILKLLEQKKVQAENYPLVVLFSKNYLNRKFISKIINNEPKLEYCSKYNTKFVYKNKRYK
jgi:hypothetical protein